MSKGQACETEQCSLIRPDPRQHVLHKTVWENHSVLTHGGRRNDIKYLAGRRVIKWKRCFPACQWLPWSHLKKNSWQHLLYFYFLKDFSGNFLSLNHPIYVHLFNEGKEVCPQNGSKSGMANLEHNHLYHVP